MRSALLNLTESQWRTQRGVDVALKSLGGGALSSCEGFKQDYDRCCSVHPHPHMGLGRELAPLAISPITPTFQQR